MQSERVYVVLLFINIIALLVIYWLTGSILKSKTKFDINYSIMCDHDFLDCKNFSSFDAANIAYSYCYSLVGRDIHHLDNDGDGVACE